MKLVVMENTMRGAKNIHRVFDLKGSMVNRIVPGKDFAPTKTLKDLNLLAIKEGNIMLRFSKKDRIQIMESLKKDL